MGNECGNLKSPQKGGQLLHAGSAVAKNEPLFAHMQPGDDCSGVLQAPDKIDLDLLASTWCGRDDHQLAMAFAMSCQPVQQFHRISDCRGQSDPLNLSPG